MMEELPFIHDVVIIGAGPCGLAVAARLREQTPSALFTEAEHNRYHWIHKHTHSASIKNSRTGNIRRGSGPESDGSPSMLILDSSGKEWLTKWKMLFKRLEITHLRSPMFFHPDPQDRDGLLAFAHAEGREAECVEIVGCVGKEISKHQIKKKRKARKAANEQ
jgi:choline dehydrogenase-like flavoprotein